MRLAGHCIRHEDKIANKLVLWQPNDGQVKRGRQKINFIDVLLQDTGVTSTAELKTIMLDRSDWRGRVQNVVRPAGPTEPGGGGGGALAPPHFLPR